MEFRLKAVFVLLTIVDEIQNPMCVRGGGCGRHSSMVLILTSQNVLFSYVFRFLLNSNFPCHHIFLTLLRNKIVSQEFMMLKVFGDNCCFKINCLPFAHLVGKSIAQCDSRLGVSGLTCNLC